MKVRYESNFEYGKKQAKYCIAAAVILGLVTVFLAPANSMTQTLMLILTVAAMVSCVVIIYKNCRCPYCGKHIMMGVLRVKVCPACNRNLENGKKTKKYER